MKPHPRRPRLARIAALAAAALLLAAVPRSRADVLPPGYSGLIDLTSNPNSGGTYDPAMTYTVGMEPYMTQSGWNIREMIFAYNKTTDTLLVDVKTQGIAGDADGLGIPGQSDPQLASYYGYNPANLGGRDSISVAFRAANANGTIGDPVAIAGVPEYKPANAPQDGFQVASYNGSKILQTAYGSPLAGISGTLLNGGPSAQHPDFEFTITNFSKIVGLSPTNGFYFSAYAGSPDDVVAGEDTIPWTFVNKLTAAQTVPGLPNPNTPLTPGAVPGASNAPTPHLITVPNLNPVPEPSSVVLCGLGVVGLAVVEARRRRANAA